MARTAPMGPPTGSSPSGQRSTRASSARRLLVAHWAALVLTVIAVVFIAQNRADVSIDLFWLHATAPMWFVLVGTLLVGVLVGVLASRRRARNASVAAGRQ